MAMQKLYKENELWFSLLWIIIYVIGTSVCDKASEVIGITKSVTFVFHIILCIKLIVWLRKNKLYEEYGLCRSPYSASEFLFYIPLFVLASCNLWFGVVLNFSILETFLYIGSMLCVGFIEELIFRGFLFKSMCKNGVRSAIIVSSITFGIGHILNLFNGSGAELLASICQVCYAAAFGYLFVIIFYKGKSLWPCIATHGVLNSLVAFANRFSMTPNKKIIISLILCVVAISYAIILQKKLPKTDKVQAL